jgi:hypothetical protein
MARLNHYYHLQVQQWKMPGAEMMQLLRLSWRRRAADEERKGG